MAMRLSLFIELSIIFRSNLRAGYFRTSVKLSESLSADDRRQYIQQEAGMRSLNDSLVFNDIE